jgi:hypothetical protein
MLGRLFPGQHDLLVAHFPQIRCLRHDFHSAAAYSDVICLATDRSDPGGQAHFSA